MLNFHEWVNKFYSEQISSYLGKETSDYSAIDRIYDKSDLAVSIVQDYDRSTNKKFLTNITYIMPLNDAGKWGLYNSADNRNILQDYAKNKYKFNQKQLNRLESMPLSVLKNPKYGIDPEILKSVLPSDTIRVNVLDIYNKFNQAQKNKTISPEEAQIDIIREIASTIIHESKHDQERRREELTGQPMSGEQGPVQEEEIFKKWFDRNIQMLKTKYPQLSQTK